MKRERITYVAEMADPLRPASQRTLRPLTDEQARRIYAGIYAEDGQEDYDAAARDLAAARQRIIEGLARFRQDLYERLLAHRRAQEARRRRYERIGTGLGVCVLLACVAVVTWMAWGVR